MGSAPFLPSITPHTEYLRLGRTDEEKRQAYRALFKAHLDTQRMHQIWQATNGNYALGNERFKAEIEQVLKRRATPRKGGRPVNRKRPND